LSRKIPTYERGHIITNNVAFRPFLAHVIGQVQARYRKPEGDAAVGRFDDAMVCRHRVAGRGVVCVPGQRTVDERGARRGLGTGSPGWRPPCATRPPNVAFGADDGVHSWASATMSAQMTASQARTKSHAITSKILRPGGTAVSGSRLDAG
jgi:hypothetical protein